MSLAGSRAKKAVQEWCVNVAKDYNLSVSDLSTSFADGMVLCAIIHKHDSSMIKFETLNASNAKENVDLAVAAAKNAGIEDIAFDFADIGDEKTLYSFIGSLFKKFNPDSPLLKKEKGNEEPQESGEKSEKRDRRRRGKKDEEAPKEEPQNPVEPVAKTEETKMEDSVVVQAPETVKVVEDHFEKPVDVDNLIKSTEEVQNTRKPRARRGDKKEEKTEEPKPEAVKEEQVKPVEEVKPEPVQPEPVQEVKSEPIPEPVKEEVKVEEPKPEPVKEVVPEPVKVVEEVKPEPVKEVVPEPVKVVEEVKPEPVKVESKKKGKKGEEKKVEEPKKEEPKPEPKVEQPKPEPKVEEPKPKAQVKKEEPKIEEPKAQVKKEEPKPKVQVKKQEPFESKGGDDEILDVDDLLDEKIPKVLRRKKKKGAEQKEPDSVEESLEDAYATIDNLEIDLELRTADATRLRKQNQVYQSEIRKLISSNNQLAEDVRNLSARIELEERASGDFKSKATADIERLEEELKTTKQVLNDELNAKKELLKETKKAKKEANLATDKAEREEKKVVALNDQIRLITKEKEELEGVFRDATIKLEGAARENIDLKVTVDTLKNLLEKKNKENEVLKKKYEEIEIEHDHMVAEIEQERNEREATEEQAAKLNIQIEKLKKALIQVKKQKEEAEASIQTFKSDMADLRFQIEAEKQNTLKEEREKRDAIEKLKDAVGKTESHSEDITSVQRQVKKREREAEKYRIRVEEQAKVITKLEQANNELKAQQKKSTDQKEESDYKLQQMTNEKNEILKQLKELEIYKKFAI